MVEKGKLLRQFWVVLDCGSKELINQLRVLDLHTLFLFHPAFASLSRRCSLLGRGRGARGRRRRWGATRTWRWLLLRRWRLLSRGSLRGRWTARSAALVTGVPSGLVVSRVSRRRHPVGTRWTVLTVLPWWRVALVGLLGRVAAARRRAVAGVALASRRRVALRRVSCWRLLAVGRIVALCGVTPSIGRIPSCRRRRRHPRLAVRSVRRRRCASWTWRRWWNPALVPARWHRTRRGLRRTPRCRGLRWRSSWRRRGGSG